MSDLATSIRSILDAPHAEVRDKVRDLLSRPELLPGDDLPSNQHRELVLEQCRILAEQGGSNLGFPPSYGGGGDVGASIASFETLAWGDLSLLVKSGVQFGLFGGAVLHLGTDRHHDRYLGDILSLELPGCFAMTETGHGSDVQSLQTTATYDPDTAEFVIHTPDDAARKDYIGNAAAHGRMAAVFAQLETQGERHGVHCFLVRIRDEQHRPMPGITIGDCGDKLGLNGVDNGRLWFDQVRIPREDMLDKFASVAADGTYSSDIESPSRRFFTMVGTLVQGRVSVGGAAINAAKKALAIAIRYGEQRTQFTVPDGDDEVTILDYRMHQRRLLIPLAKTYALHFAQADTRSMLHDVFTADDVSDDERQVLEARAAGIKALGTWHSLDTIQTCREACGGAGYLAENRFGVMRDDLDVFATFEGDNTVLLQLVAKSLLTDFRQDFGELDTIGTVRFVAEQFAETVMERTAARKILQTLKDALPGGRDEEPDILDADYHLALLAWREEHLTTSVARRLKNGMDSGAEPFAVFNDCQDHMVAAARAHIERIAVSSFHAAVDACEDEACAAVLRRLAALHALATIEADRGWFLEHGRLSGARSKAVIAAVNRLCGQVREDARALVDAFGIPDAALGAPIAFTTVPEQTAPTESREQTLEQAKESA
jgi:acyl-CoA oxidase